MSLILTVKDGDHIRILADDGQSVWITVHLPHGGRNQIEIEAPRSFEIARDALLGPGETFADTHPGRQKRQQQ